MEKNKFIVNFLLKEVILKYLFCYILSVITLSVPLIFKINDPWNSWLISFSASIFSLPVIFVIYSMKLNTGNPHKYRLPAFNFIIQTHRVWFNFDCFNAVI